jgi:hypothetical protein
MHTMYELARDACILHEGINKINVMLAREVDGLTAESDAV